MQYGPKIVRSGLVLHLDAADRKSYPGSGTVWRDLSGNSSNATLTGFGVQTIFNSDKGGNIIFDGSDDRGDITVKNLSSTATIEMWCKIGTGLANKIPFGWNAYAVWCKESRLGFNTGNNDDYGISYLQVLNLGIINNWKHYIFEMRSDVSYTNNKIYVNTQLQSLSQQSGTEAAANRNFNNSVGAIGTFLANPNNYAMPMNCSIVRIYNRSLSQAEVNQNFNANRARFGI